MIDKAMLKNLPNHEMRSRAVDPTHAAFGYTLDGKPASYVISEGPHWIVCGQTGSGKSVFANQILISMMFHSYPNELKIMWVDPKKVEAGPYKGCPFCPIDPVLDMGDAYGLMMYLTWEMDRRYDDLEEVGAKNIVGFNKWVKENPEKAKEKGLEPMPYMVAMIDEYADMVAQEPEVEKPIIRLGAKARACGIHLIIATQRPSATIISGNLKANIPGRICLKVADGTNSMIVLDEYGGEDLLGMGDALVKDKNGKIRRMQGAYVDDEEEIPDIFAALREKFGSPEPINYKQIVVDNGLCQWAEEYDEDTPIEDRHVKSLPRRRR